MKGLVKGLWALALATALIAAPASAQMPVQFGVGAGVTLPLGDFGDAAKLGFHGNALVQFTPAGSPVGIRIDGMYNRNDFSDDVGADGTWQIISGTANAVYVFQTADASMFHPYLLAGAGAYNVKASSGGISDSETKLGVNGGAGFDFNAGGAVVFIEGRFHNIFLGDGDGNLQMVPITLGVKFGGK